MCDSSRKVGNSEVKTSCCTFTELFLEQPSVYLNFILNVWWVNFQSQHLFDKRLK